MKRSIVNPLFPLSLSALASLGANASDIEPQRHTVLPGESFSAIVHQFASKDNPKLRYSYQKFYEAMERFKSVNLHIKDFNLINPGDEINVPVEFGINNDEVISRYKIKYGDNLHKIVNELFQNENPWEIISLLKEFNPFIKNVNLIKAGDTLKVPREEYLSSLKQMERSRKRKIASLGIRRRFTPSPSLKKEIYSLTIYEARKYSSFFQSIVNADSKLDVMKELKASLNYSRSISRYELEDAMLFLISSTLKSKDDEIYLDDLKAFFEVWKDRRAKKQSQFKKENFSQ